MSRLSRALTTGWRRPPTARAGVAAWRASRRERVLVDVGPTVPGAVLRVVLAALGGLVLVLSGLTDLGPAGGGGLGSLLLGAAVGCLALAVVRPGGIGPGALVCLVAVRLLQEEVRVDVRTCALVLAVHGLLVVVALAAQARWRARVEVALVVQRLREAAVLQLGAQALALAAAAVLASGAGADGASWFRLAAVVAALAAVGVLALGRWRASDADPGAGSGVGPGSGAG